jgi:sugar lactone lactonase YvrE
MLCAIPCAVSKISLNLIAAATLPVLAFAAACGGNEPPAQPPISAAASVAEPPRPAVSATQPPSSTGATPPAANVEAASAKPAPVLSLHDSGFLTPESVYYDAKRDVYLVSNVNGSPSAADNNGFLSRVWPDGKVELKWIDAGKKGVKLDAPKGITELGDTIYVADITRVRLFDAETGKPKGEVVLPGATFANDVTASPDGKVYVSDTGIKIDDKGVSATKTDAVYVIEKGKAKTIATGEQLGHPNGVLYAGDKLWVVGFGNGELYSLDKAGAKQDAQKMPKGSLDGIVPLGDGLLVSSWDAQAVYRGKPGSSFEIVISGVKSPADIGYDTKRSRVLVPLFQGNAIEAYELK